MREKVQSIQNHWGFFLPIFDLHKVLNIYVYTRNQNVLLPSGAPPLQISFLGTSYRASFPQTKHHFIANYCKLQVEGTAFPCFQRKIQLGWTLQTGKHSVWFTQQRHPLTALYMGVWHSLNCEWTKPDASDHWKVKSSSRKIQHAVKGETNVAGKLWPFL